MQAALMISRFVSRGGPITLRRLTVLLWYTIANTLKLPYRFKQHAGSYFSSINPLLRGLWCDNFCSPETARGAVDKVLKTAFFQVSCFNNGTLILITQKILVPALLNATCYGILMCRLAICAGMLIFCITHQITPARYVSFFWFRFF